MFKASINASGLGEWFSGFLGRPSSRIERIVSSLNQQINAKAGKISVKIDTFSMSKEAFVKQDWVKELYLSPYRGGGDIRLLSNAKYVEWDGGTFYLDHSPSGKYVSFFVGTRDVSISQEAADLLFKNRRAEIEEMIASGESIKSIPRKEYNYFTNTTGGDLYAYLCLDKRTKESRRAEAIAMCEAWGNGGEIDNAKFRELTRYDYKHDGFVFKYYEEARWKRLWQERSDRLTAAFEENGIVLDKDEVLDIQLSIFHKYTVSGIENPEKQQKIENIANDVLPKILGMSGSWNVELPSFSKFGAATHQTAAFVGACEKYLEDSTNGTTLADMSLGKDGKIYGGLPQETLDKLNAAVILKPTDDYDYILSLSKEERKMSELKESFTMALRAVQQSGYEKVPRLNCYFSYSNGQVKQIDKWTLG
ncbi:MAG: hypothetical protein LBC93_04405 [Synergistaceae bacterium]|nr:hypothetical protein [Synergistaceae bacterium]